MAPPPPCCHNISEAKRHNTLDKHSSSSPNQIQCKAGVYHIYIYMLKTPSQYQGFFFDLRGVLPYKHAYTFLYVLSIYLLQNPSARFRTVPKAPFSGQGTGARSSKVALPSNSTLQVLQPGIPSGSFVIPPSRKGRHVQTWGK